MFDMFEVRFWAKMWCSEVFEVRSYCYVTRLVLEFTVWCSRTVRVFVMFDMFEVRFWAKMWCSDNQCSIVFEVRYFGVRSKTIFDANNPLSFFTAHFVCQQQRILCLKFHFKLQKHTFETSFNHSLYIFVVELFFFHTSFLSLQTVRLHRAAQI